MPTRTSGKDPRGPPGGQSGLGENGLHPPRSGGIKAYTVKPMRCHVTGLVEPREERAARAGLGLSPTTKTLDLNTLFLEQLGLKVCEN